MNVVLNAPTALESRGRRTFADATVIICAYTMDRWLLLQRAVRSVLAQHRLPLEIIVCIDHNDALYERARDALSSDGLVPVRVVANRYSGRLGSARTTAAEVAVGSVLVFLDDDAAADPTWLASMLAPYEQPDVVAVGGAPRPEYAGPRPKWFPPEFDWVFGCTYAGLPEQLAPTLRLIGAAMSVRRDALMEIGGFHSDNHDDMDMCHRLAARWPDRRILFEPAAVVSHYVPLERLSWAYFWRRCFTVNRGKVRAHRAIDGVHNLSADRKFVSRALSIGVAREVNALRHGDVTAVSRVGSMVVGLMCAAGGYARGTLDEVLAGTPGRPTAREGETKD
jgi:cellulose synthase/poly-beta-1,6-N-acetylglucosamine synthase-like glycosyltransferase